MWLFMLSHMLWLVMISFSFVLVLLGGIFVGLYFMIRGKRIRDSLQQENTHLCDLLNMYKEKVIKLETENHYLSKQLPQLQEQMVQKTRAAVLQSATELSSKLLDDYKREHKIVAKEAQEKIETTTKSMTSHVESIAKNIFALGEEAKTHRVKLQRIETGLLEPIKGGVMSETILENTLQCFGFIEGRDYTLQATLSGAEYQNLRPDALVFLPDDAVMVIDSKSSPAFVSDQEDNDKDVVQRLKSHIKNLSSKGYHHAVKDAAVMGGVGRAPVKKVITFMFLPTDHVLTRIQKADAQLMQKAMQEGIIMGGPSVLWSVLSVFNMRIRAQQQSENYEKMLVELDSLLDYVAKLSDHAGKIEKGLRGVVSVYNDFAGSANGRLFAKGQRLQEMGGFHMGNRVFTKLSKIAISKVETVDHDDLVQDVKSVTAQKKDEY